MKVRLKLVTGDRLGIEVPVACTLADLQGLVASQGLGSLELAPQVLLSFNKRDVLAGAPDTPLCELGICNGDLLWVLSPELPPVPQAAPITMAERAAEPEAKRASDGEGNALTTSLQEQQEQQQVADVQDKGKEVLANTHKPLDDEQHALLPPSQRTPAYLLRTLQHSCNKQTRNAELLLLAAHAAMLEVGFLPSWAASGGNAGSAGMYHVPDSCWISRSICRVTYHLGVSNGISERNLGNDPHAQGETEQEQEQPPACTLQFSSMGDGAMVLAVAAQTHMRYLSLQAASYVCPLPDLTPAEADSSIHTLAAAELANCMSSASTVQLLADGGLAIDGRMQMDLASTRRLWTELKDGLAFPMLLAAYAEAGLPPPAGLLALPEDLKQSLLEALGPVDLASLCGACSELRHLASQDELWRPLLEREFPQAPSSFTAQAQRCGYKWAFALCWRQRRQREEELHRARSRTFVPVVPRFGVPRPPFYPPLPHPGFSGFIGGDYDRLPQFGPGTGLPGQFGGGTAPGGLFFGSGRRQGRGALGGLYMH